MYLAEDSTKAYIQVVRLSLSSAFPPHASSPRAILLLAPPMQAVKCVRRKNKSDRLKKLRRNADLPRTPHTPLVDQLGSTEHKIRKEIAIMKKLNHPHVVRLLEVIDDPLTDKIYMGAYSILVCSPVSYSTPRASPVRRSMVCPSRVVL